MILISIFAKIRNKITEHIKMAAIRFQLLYPKNTDKIQSVYMIISIGDCQRIRLRVPNIQIHPRQWDKSKGRVKLLTWFEF